MKRRSQASEIIFRQRTRLKWTMWLVIALFASPSSAQQRLDSSAVQPDPPAAKRAIQIPDGTAVEMRFAQPVVGKGPDARRDSASFDTAEAEPGDKVRLIAAADVRLDSVVIIAKGAIGQATVTKVKGPLSTLSYSGIGLQLGWIEDINGKRLPLRGSVKGKPQSFMVMVLGTPAGVIAGPKVQEGKGPGQWFYHSFVHTELKQSIPAGTRIFGYIHGAASLDAAGSAADSGDSKTSATLTLYELRYLVASPSAIECDGNPVGQIGAQQYLVINLAAGKHSCRLRNHQELELVVESGAEYFLHVDSKEGVLRSVTVGEGDDAIANLDPAKRLK